MDHLKVIATVQLFVRASELEYKFEDIGSTEYSQFWPSSYHEIEADLKTSGKIVKGANLTHAPSDSQATYPPLPFYPRPTIIIISSLLTKKPLQVEFTS